MLKANICKGNGTSGCDVGAGESSEIQVGSDCISDAQKSVTACRCYVLPCDSDCMKESSEWTAVMCGAVVC